MVSQKQLKKLLTSVRENNGCKTWNTYRKVNSNVQVDLQEANLENMNLEKINLQEANLVWSYMLWSNLQQANMEKANLQRAKLQGANLKQAVLRDAILEKANLQLANLQRADLEGAILRGAYLSDVFLQEANLQNVNLVGAELLETNLQGAKLTGANLERVTFLWGNNISSDQLSTCENLTGIRGLLIETMMELKEKAPELMSWWTKDMLQVADIERYKNHGRWVKKEDVMQKSGQWILKEDLIDIWGLPKKTIIQLEQKAPELIKCSKKKDVIQKSGQWTLKEDLVDIWDLPKKTMMQLKLNAPELLEWWSEDTSQVLENWINDGQWIKKEDAVQENGQSFLKKNSSITLAKNKKDESHRFLVKLSLAFLYIFLITSIMIAFYIGL